MEQNNRYYADPELTACTTTVFRTAATGAESAIALVDNIVRPAGGGEPCDRGILSFDGQQLVIASASKHDGLTWLRVAQANVLPTVGDTVRVELDAFHRERRRRLHTGLHLLIRSCMVFADIQVMAADISEDASYAKMSAKIHGVADDDLFDKIARKVNEILVAALPVEVVKAKSADDARRLHGPLFRMSERYMLTGKLRLIKIGDFDVNPCAGLHWRDTAIGPCGLQLTVTSDGLEATLRILGAA